MLLGGFSEEKGTKRQWIQLQMYNPTRSCRSDSSSLRRSETLDREPRDDISLLANYFARKHGALIGKFFDRIGPSITGALIHYDWPGNVQELENVERGCAALFEWYVANQR